MTEASFRRRHERVGRRWRRFKPKVRWCPDCRCHTVVLNDSYFHRFRRFFIECENCHWCGKSYPTIGMAVRSWNRESRRASK